MAWLPQALQLEGAELEQYVRYCREVPLRGFRPPRDAQGLHDLMASLAGDDEDGGAAAAAAAVAQHGQGHGHGSGSREPGATPVATPGGAAAGVVARPEDGALGTGAGAPIAPQRLPEPQAFTCLAWPQPGGKLPPPAAAVVAVLSCYADVAPAQLVASVRHLETAAVLTEKKVDLMGRAGSKDARPG